MIASKQITNAVIYVFAGKKYAIFKKIANFNGKLLRNYK